MASVSQAPSRPAHRPARQGLKARRCLQAVPYRYLNRELDDDGAEDLLEALEDELRRRRLSPAGRLEVESSMPGHVLQLLMRELQVSATQPGGFKFRREDGQLPLMFIPGR